MEEYHWIYDEEWNDYLQNILFLEEPHYLVDSSSENRLEGAHFYGSQHLCPQSFLRDELDAPLHGDVLIPWPALEEGAHNKGDKELREELGGDAAVEKREGSEVALFSPTQYRCTSSTTSTDQSCFSQDSFLAALEGDRHKGKKDLKQELGRNAGGKKRRLPVEKPLLTFELVSQYFCMPVKQAGEELNVGLTHLKRQCRELGIPRWPHRKVKSLETLIKNAQELGKPKIEVDKVQRKKKLIEERPGHVELDQEMKLLRQACFKEKFKRRRLVAIQG